MDRVEYVRLVLAAYRATPGVAGVVRRADRLLAAQLHERGVSFETVENAFVLAASRRLVRPEGAAPRGNIRSLASFLAGHRRGTGDEREPRVLSISPVQTQTFQHKMSLKRAEAGMLES